MKIVLDINALLISIPKKSVYRPIFDGLINGVYELVLSNEILSEYLEIIERKSNSLVANNIAEMLLNLQNLKKIEVFFNWRLMANDNDDNKYVDAAITGGADYIVSNDQHFNILRKTEFPKITVISIDKFLSLMNR
ncbi:putative toxin-antitoxin system toxin component, PIN family [Pararcticibacter amylolyticus]|uniref:Putative toxin-antitoxin system toxin component, PIN family n=1 Tax=Pararcticibacter amylolyticus TaxID=2173175 RepID=A0A2U2PC22_9SPHI|nr:putative toxin-antitoxin system toxin component, PIN family [Pararcticibacter amylolyticus]PWG78948.1 putative toxin-antitoxin system toxin component, PIN family [Pararcticibacter amylolyticus]